MTTSAAVVAAGTGSGPSRLQATLRAVRLALGMTDGMDAVQDWTGVLRAAVAERCASLAWVRCGTEIAIHAPPGVTAAFRSHFASNSARIRLMLAASRGPLIALGQRGIHPIVLKGPPLSLRLYGESAARICSDLDWFVAPSQQAAVREIMLSAGWEPIEGEDGGEFCYGQQGGRGHMYIEVHSSLLHPRYSYLRLPSPRGTPIVIDGISMVVHNDPLLVGYLSVHLATHRFAPLAWIVDLLEYWESMDPEARAHAYEAAALAGIRRYLAWALGRADLVRRAALGDHAAAHRLGLREGTRVEAHPMWRHISLAPTPTKRIKAAWTWIAPTWVGARGVGAFRATVERVAAHWRDALPVRQEVG